MCISVKSVVDKIIFNILSNKTQVSALTKLLFRFNKLLKIDSSKDVNFSIFFDCLKSNLALILDSRNEKTFQNLSCFLKLCLKSDSGVVDPNEFCSKIIYDYFKLDSIDVESYIFILDIYDILIKFSSLDLAQITFIIELYSNLRLKSIEKKNSSDALLKLTEKCLILIKNMVKLKDKLKFDDKEMENFRILARTRHHWTVSLIVYPIAEQIFIPKCLSPYVSGLQAKIVHLESKYIYIFDQI
ncbi:hypothetical protein BpHYR1_024417 [Brachionus plicatilis]|uniref:Uncharacterized protein n=1 Tax=Brachionus plicatilis TaxID=10195 RepID=A0A3M7QH93_BRAPC|nr:hypothetical protein BpHYR1_024417 [Brachionus plicatilis]